MKTFATLLLCLLSPVFLFAQENPGWIRYQAISPDGSDIVFTYKGDLYVVDAGGGDARQITFHEAHDFMPVWSSDGSKIAFASDRYGNFDVYVMDAQGGPADRLTFHSADEHPYSFSEGDAALLFGAARLDDADHRQFPAGSQPELYSVPVEGGRIDQVFTIPAEYVQVSADGATMLYHDKKGGENEWRKHHTSSITRDIWMFDAESGEHTMITDFGGEDRQPVFTENEQAFYYLSEESGSFNVHKYMMEQGEAEQLTNFTFHPVRFLSYGGGILSFGYDGELYTMQEGGEPRKVDVTIRTQNVNNSDKFITINGGVNEMAISPDGKEMAFVARGEVFVTSVDGSLTKRITNTPESEAFVTFSPDGESVVYASERDGRWSIYQTRKVRDEEPFFYAATLLEEEELVNTDVDNYLPSFSPDGKKLAFIADRRTLRVMNMESKDTVDLMTPEDLFHMSDGDKYFTWSPDSKWLLFDWSKVLHNSEVLLLAADGSERINLTESGYYDSTPKWMNDGKQMIWFSNRDGLKSYATSGRSERDVYAMFFTQEEWDKFNMSEEEYKLIQEIEKAEKEGEEKEDSDSDDEKTEESTADLTFDQDKMKEQTARLTIHSSYLSDAVLSKDGSKLYYLSQFEDDYNLWETDLRTKDTKMLIKLNTGFGSLQWDKKMENLYLLSRGRISKLDVSAGSSSSIEIAGEMMYDEQKEREHLFEHIFIRTKNIFYEPTDPSRYREM